MITVTAEAAHAIGELCAAAGRSPSVRVRAVGAGTPVPVQLEADSEHRPSDLVAASGGVMVLVERELAAAIDDHTLEVRPGDEQDPPRFYFTAP
jgi:Fe-S cluster assembly iron-binding protein IscA